MLVLLENNNEDKNNNNNNTMSHMACHRDVPIPVVHTKIDIIIGLLKHTMSGSTQDNKLEQI